MGTQKYSALTQENSQCLVPNENYQAFQGTGIYNT